MHEFRFGDRVKTIDDGECTALGTVVNESTYKPLGDFNACLPLPVAVLWDEPGEVWWVSGTDLSLV